MTLRLLTLVLCLTLAGCGSSWNPFNWGQREQVLIRTEDGGGGSPAMLTVADPRPRMPQVAGIQIDPMPTGAILTARGLPPQQGWWAAELVRVPAARTPAGSLAFVFKAVPAPTPQPAGAQRTREVVAAATLTRGDLTGVSRIIVAGESNQLSVRP